MRADGALLSIVLVISTALAVGTVVGVAIGREVEIVDELRDVLLRVLPVTMLIILAGGTLAYLLARRVREPEFLLAAAAARLREGDLSTPIPCVKEAELAPLRDELERARSSLQANLEAISKNLEAISKEEARQRALFAALREPIITTSTDGRVTGFNAAAGALLGGPVRLYGQPVREILPFVAAPAEHGGAEQAAPETTWQGYLTDAVGHTLDVEVSRTRLGEGQLPAGDVYVVHDISRHAELNRLREQLLYDVAHELRGPLAVLDNVLEILAAEYAELSAGEFDRLLRSARRTTAGLCSLTEDLLSAGSIQSGRLVARPRPTELSAIVDDALETVEPIIAARGQRVERHLPDKCPEVLADRRYLSRVLANLLSNASKYSPDGEVIRVRAERPNGQVRVTVEDRGPGIPAAQQAGLFERFYRVRSGHRQPGTGLGLAIAKGIVEAHGGSIGVESEAGTGTRVWFTLPTTGGTEDEDPPRERRPRAG